MAAEGNEMLAHKISDLTESLCRTTDVLSSADRMIDHYRDLNREHEHEIARLQGDLFRMNRNQEYETAMINKETQSNRGPQSTVYKKVSPILSDISSIDDDFINKASSSKRRSSTVRFQSEKPSKLDLLETSISNISQRQRNLEQEFNNEKSRERNLDITLQKELLSMKDENRNQRMLEEKIQKLQDKIDYDHEKWKAQHKEMKNIAFEMSSLKETMKDATTTNRQNRLEDESSELFSFKKKILEDKELIDTLRSQLKESSKEKSVMKSTVEEIKNIGAMKANQLKLLERQLDQEQQERSELQKNLRNMQNRADDLEKERSELLIQVSDMKAEAKLVAMERSTQNVPELKALLERSERQRDRLSEHIYKLKDELESKESQLVRLMRQFDEQTKQISSVDAEKSALVSQAEMNANRYFELRKDLDSLSDLLKATDSKLKESEKSRQQLKEKAVNSLKEYRLRCRKLEQRLEEEDLARKNKEVELAKESARAKEIEISNLKLQKEQQELACDLQHVKQELEERERRMGFLSEEKHSVEHALSQASVDARLIADLKKENEELKNEKLNFHSQLLSEKKKLKECEDLLQENYKKQLAVKDEASSLKRQLQEERDSKSQIVVKLQQEHQTAADTEIKKVENRTRILEDERNELLDKVKKLESLQNDLSRSMVNLDKEKTERLEKEKQMVQRIKKVTDENIRIRKQYRAMKQSLEGKIEKIQSTVSMEKNQKDILQSHINEYQTENSKVKDTVKVLMSIAMRDAENLLNLLCREEENQLPVKEIPDSMLPDHQKILHELRDKLQSCYSISKTLKQRFQQQKLLIRKAQERIKNQIQELNECKEINAKESEVNKCKVDDLERSKKESNKVVLEQKRKLACLQDQVKTLTKHLEECTNALEKTLEMNEDRGKILQELEQLRNAHFENQRLDESFYRHSEKMDVLTNKLYDAKNTLNQIKQESMDNTLFTKRVIENFSSVSPTRKRRIEYLNTPKVRRSRVSLFNELEKTPLRDLDPMSMTDEEFDQIFLPKKTLSPPISILKTPNSSGKKDLKNKTRSSSSRKSTSKHRGKTILQSELT